VVVFRVTEQANQYFVLQARRGHGTNKTNLASLIVGTLDNVWDSKVSSVIRDFN